MTTDAHDTRRSYTVVGAGAVGLLYGARLAVAGHPVRWVIRTGADRVRHEGITVTTPGGVLHVDPSSIEVHDDPAAVPRSDVVLVALKTTANARLAELVGPAVADGATVAMFQNGLDVEQQLRDQVPHAGPVLGAMCFVCCTRRQPGVADHVDYGAVTVGSLDDRWSGHAAALVADLGAAGVDAAVVDRLGVARWTKLVWNIPFNGLSVVLGARTDEMLGHPPTRSLVTALMDEVAEAADACGHPLDADTRERMLATTDAMTPYATSMYLDHEAGRPLEHEAIYRVPLRAAETAGAPMRRVAVLADQLRFLDDRAHWSAR